MERIKIKEMRKLFRKGEYLTAQQLADYLQVSEKTARTGISELNDELLRHGARIISKPRFGYCLEIHDQDSFEAYCMRDGLPEIPNGTTERNEYLMACLIFRRDYVKIEELCDFLYVSRTTVSFSIKAVEAILGRYRLSIERRPNYGLRIHGNEFDIRRLIVDYFIKRHSLDGMNITYQIRELEELAGDIRLLMEKYGLFLSEIAFDNFVNYTYVAWKRMKAGYFLQMEKDKLPEIGIREQLFVRELLDQLKSRKDITYTGDEEEYLCIYLSGKRIIGNTMNNDVNFVIHEYTDKLAMEMLKLVSHDYHMDLQHNFELRMTLNQHLVPFDIRIRYSIPLENPLLKAVQEQYGLAYQMAGVASSVLRNFYQKEISEDEIGYFALIFQLALEGRKKGTAANILIVCNTGKATSRLLKYKYEQRFSEYLDQIQVCNTIELETFDFTAIDYVFTTVPIIREIPVPIMEVGLFLEDDDVRKVIDVLEYGNSGAIIDHYYGKKRFLADVEGGEKEEILKYLCDVVTKQEIVDDNFYELVLERENLIQMDYGNRVAIPHPNQLASEESFAYVAVLKKPVIWNRYPVQVVLLVSIGRKTGNEKERQRFYEMTASFALSKEAVDRLLESPDYETFIRLLPDSIR